MISSKLMSEQCHSQRCFAHYMLLYNSMRCKVLTSVHYTTTPLHIFLMRLPLYDLTPASGQTWLTLPSKVRTRALCGGEPPAHQTLNKTAFPASFLLCHTRSSHAGYASAISMQPVAWPVWWRTRKHGALLS